MGLDFWNNPIVVSAFRVKYRNRGLFNRTAVYVLLLVVVGAAFQYKKDTLGPLWPRYYFLTLTGISLLVASISAAGNTSNSIKTEVVSRTLDFQRIAALSPRQILVGKMLGEPAQAYFCVLASIPLAAFCLFVGGVSLELVLIVYLNLITTTILFSAMGLGNRLEPPAGQADIGIAGLAGFSTPFLLFNALRLDDPWDFGLLFPNFHVPLLVVLPAIQLLLAYVCFHTMERRLLNPLLPGFSKPLAYALLLLLDAVALVTFFSIPAPHTYRCVGFCLAHLVIAVWLITAVTPWKETLHSWVWRYRGRLPRLLDLWIGERSSNQLVLLTLCLSGVIFYLPLVFMRAPWGDVFPDATYPQFQAALGAKLAAMLLTVLLILTFGALHQRALLLVGRNGAAALLVVALILDLPPQIAGQYYNSELILSFSPSAHFVRLFKDPAHPLDLLPVLCVYGGILILCGWSLHDRMRRLERAVDVKLLQMGVTPEPAPVRS
jgi:hypothetical protein